MAFVETDVADASRVKKAKDYTVDKYGRLDIMVNNAEAGTLTGTRVDLVHEAISNKGISVNVKGVWLGTTYAAEQFLKQEPHYWGSRLDHQQVQKGAVMQFTRATACEYAPDRIHINAINSGFTDTGILEGIEGRTGLDEFEKWMTARHSWGRIATPDDMAKVAMFIAKSGIQSMVP